MDVTDIQDRQFGLLRWKDHWGWCADNVEWSPGLKIDLCINAELTESNTISDHVKNIFNTLRDRENEYKSLAARDLLDVFNSLMVDDEDNRPDGWPFDATYLINLMTLKWVYIVLDAGADSELQYWTYEGPILRVFISHDLCFKEALFD